MRLDIWESNMESLPLLSGDTMPVVGLGTYPLKGEQCKRVVKQALDLGYTHFDTAWIYRNQREIGEALREAGVDRSEAVHHDKSRSRLPAIRRGRQTGG